MRPRHDRRPAEATGGEWPLNVVIETPRGATAKFKWDEMSGLFHLSRPLPAGLTYPFDWGFVPGTRAEDRAVVAFEGKDLVVARWAGESDADALVTACALR